MGAGGDAAPADVPIRALYRGQSPECVQQRARAGSLELEISCCSLSDFIEEVGVALLVTVFDAELHTGRPRAGVAAVRGRRAGRTSSSTSRSVAPPRPSPSTLPAAHITHTVHATRITRHDSNTRIAAGGEKLPKRAHSISPTLSSAPSTRYAVYDLIRYRLPPWPVAALSLPPRLPPAHS